MSTPVPLASPQAQAGERSPGLSLRSRWVRLWGRVQLVLSLALTGSALAYLLWMAESSRPLSSEDQHAASEQTVRVVGPLRIRIDPECSLARKLHVTTVQPTSITTPLLTVTGTVTASLRPATGKGRDYWQFNSPELLTTYTDWQKATDDISYAETQLGQIKELSETRVSAQEKLVERLKKLVAAGTDTEKDLAAAQTDWIQAQIQGRKETHEAETAVRLARRSEAALARQLQHAGLEPDLLQSAASDLDVVMADVPEAWVSRVKLGHGCVARFFGLPDQTFTGKVRAIAPVLSKERRSLRVLFALNDPEDLLRPGMFADIGLGTDAREALLIPPESIVHVGRADYLLVQQEAGDWRVAEAHVGELHDAAVEILSGLQAGDHVASDGVILLKPFLIQALQAGSPAGGRP